MAKGIRLLDKKQFLFNQEKNLAGKSFERYIPLNMFLNGNLTFSEMTFREISRFNRTSPSQYVMDTHEKRFIKPHTFLNINMDNNSPPSAFFFIFYRTIFFFFLVTSTR